MAGATRPARQQQVADKPPRLDLELRLLFSRHALAPGEDFFAALHIELGRRAFGDGRLRVPGTPLDRTLAFGSRTRAWSLEHAIGAPRPAWTTTPGADTNLDKLRARLVAEVHLGLAMVETPPIRFPRPVRNALLARHAKHIGQRLADLLRHPEAGSLSDELQHLLDALQRRY